MILNFFSRLIFKLNMRFLLNFTIYIYIHSQGQNIFTGLGFLSQEYVKYLSLYKPILCHFAMLVVVCNTDCNCVRNSHSTGCLL